MATCRAIFSSVSTFLSCRNLLQRRDQLPSYQQCAFLKGKVFEELGIAAPPKKPLVPFFMFKKDALPRIRAENPQLKVTELLKLMAVEWEKYPQEKKEMLKKESEAAFEEYRRIYAEYKKGLTPEEVAILEKAKEKDTLDKKLRIRRKKRADLEKPKRPTSAYSTFFREKMEANTDKSIAQKDMMKNLAEVWKTLPAVEKRIYKVDYEKSMMKYRKDLKAWEAKMIESGNLDVLGSKALRKLHKEYKNSKNERSEDGG